MKKIYLLILFCVYSLLIFSQENSETVSETVQFNIETSTEMSKKLQFQEAKHQDSVAKKLDEYRNNLPPKDAVSDNIKFDISSSIVTEMGEDGIEETNLKLNFSYQIVAPNLAKFKFDKVTDDFPAGTYLTSVSNSCKTLCNIIKKTIDEDYSDYFTNTTRLTIKIFGITDATPIGGRLPYKGEYGEFENQLIFFNNEYTDLTVTRQSGITSNAQLGFLRGQGVQKFLETYVDKFQITQNRYQLFAVEHPERGMQYRKIAVDITIHGAFDEQMEKMNDVSSLDDKRISSVDTGLTQTSVINDNCYVLIIANEKYLSPISEVAYAHNDGAIFKQFCQKIGGISEKHIIYLEDATTNMINNKLDLLQNLMALKNGAANLIVYYAGHGITDVRTSAPCLIPIDANPIKSEQLYSLSSLYKKLESIPAASIICIMDVCFNGKKRNGEAFVLKPEIPPTKKISLPDNLLTFYASQYNETAYGNAEEKHGNFTYWLLKSLKHNPSVSCLALLNNIKEEMMLQAEINNRHQLPMIEYGKSMKNIWENLKVMSN